MAVLSWGNVGNAANVLQLLGAVKFVITVANNFLRLSQNKEECRKLEQRVQTLEALVGWRTPCWSIVQQQQQPWLEALVSSALREADGLARSYRNATAWFLVRTGRSFTQQLRDLRCRIDSCCALVVSLHACQLIAQAGPLTAPLFLRVEGNEGGATPTAAVPSRDAKAPMAAWVAADGVPVPVPAHDAAADDDRDQRVK